MHEGRCSDKCIPLRVGVGHVKCGALERGLSVDGKNAIGERWKNLMVHPAAKGCALGAVAPFDE